jgi:NitT/TauT family transport system permease protein
LNILLPWVPFLIFGLIIEALVRLQIVPSYILPATSDVLKSLLNDRAELFTGLSSTAAAAVLGLMLSLILGLLAALILAISNRLRTAFLPYAVFFQTVPIIALAPVLVIWFGFGRPTVMASAFIVSVFPIIANAIAGLLSPDPRLLDLFRLHRASRLQTLWKLRLPTAMPAIFTGLKIAAGLAVIGAVVGEFVAGGGLGEVVDAARTQQRLDKVFAAVLLSSFLGLALVGLIDLFAKFVFRSWMRDLS